MRATDSNDDEIKRASLSDCYEPYENLDIDGPGCGVEEHSEDCLCDLEAAAYTPTAGYDTSDGCSTIATKVVGQPRTPAQLAQWLNEKMGAWEATRRVDVAALEQARYGWLQAQHARRRGGALRPGAEHLRAMFQAGLEIGGVAGYVGCAVDDVIAALKQETPSRSEVAAYLKVEGQLRQGGKSALAIGRTVGWSHDRVLKLAEALGLEAPASRKASKGVGCKHGPEVYERMRELRASGLSCGRIASQMGLPRSTVLSFFARSAA